MRNLLAYVPQRDKSMIAALVLMVFAQPNRQAAGQQLAETVKAMLQRWPKAADVLAAAEDDLLAYMVFSMEHWTRIYSTNPLERLNREIKRRTDVVGVFPDEASVVRLVGVVLMERADAWEVERRPFSLESMRNQHFKPRLLKLVGRESERAELRSEQAWDVAYDTIYDELPPCRDCACL